MATSEYFLETLINVERHVRMLTAATRIDQMLLAASTYLSSWPADRVGNLQKLDGGWGPFDSRGLPRRICSLADVIRISDAISYHCLALKEAGIDPNIELLELDLFFSIAKPVAESYLSVRHRPRTTGSSGTGYGHWSDQSAVAA